MKSLRSPLAYQGHEAKLGLSWHQLEITKGNLRTLAPAEDSDIV